MAEYKMGSQEFIVKQINKTPMEAIGYKYPKDLMRERINHGYHQKDRGK